MKKKKPIYVLDHKLKWSIFKLLQKKLTKDSGPVPVQGDRMLWELLRGEMIYCWFDFNNPELKNDMGVGLKLPKGREIILITNPTN